MCQSFRDGFTNITDLSAHDSVISQQVLDEGRSTAKNGVQTFVEKRDLLAIQGLNQYCLHLLGNNCSILFYSLQAQQLQLSSC